MDNILEFFYQPAKDKVKFKRIISGEAHGLSEHCSLKQYERDSFLLQKYGVDFINDIAAEFDGCKEMHIKATMTKDDYEDLNQMIEEYNNMGKRPMISASLLAELPNMEDTFDSIKKYGGEVIDIVNRYIGKIEDINSDNEIFVKHINIIKEDTLSKINEVRKKLTMSDNDKVNLSFVGVYSAGKSELINALLGCAILPVALKSETGHIYCIQSPEGEDPISIKFKRGGNYVLIQWDEANDDFEFIYTNDSDNLCDLANEVKTIPEQHLKINRILKSLNAFDDINSEIEIKYRIPFDDDRLKFRIYDTPGTDSNKGDHSYILRNKLDSQTHSILVYVLKQDALEGEGNSQLLNYLNGSKKIDIDRSFFVVNKSDAITPRSEIETFHEKDLVVKDNMHDDNGAQITIPLRDKKLLFITASNGYAAQSKKNGVQTDDARKQIKSAYNNVTDEEDGDSYKYYLYNRFGANDTLTKRIIEDSDAAFNIAAERNVKYDPDLVYISSGVYSLEREIVKYGKKYAPAVKAKEILDEVDFVINDFSNLCNTHKENTNSEYAKIEKELVDVQKKIKDKIDDVYNNKVIYIGSGKSAQKLHLDSGNIGNLIDKCRDFVDQEFKPNFLGRVFDFNKEASERRIQQLCYKVESLIDDELKVIKSLSMKIQREEMTDLKIKIKQIIYEQGGLSPEAKSFIVNIKEPDVTFDIDTHSLGFAISNTIKRVLIQISNPNKIKDAIESYLFKLLSGHFDTFINVYQTSIKKVLDDIKSEYEKNIVIYSSTVKTMSVATESMTRLKGDTQSIIDTLNQSKDELEQLLWNKN